MVLEYPVISIGGKEHEIDVCCINEQHRHGECENFDGRKYYKFMSIHTLKHRASHAHTQSHSCALYRSAYKAFYCELKARNVFGYSVHNRLLALSLSSFLPTVYAFHLNPSEKEGINSSNCPSSAYRARKAL